MDILDRVLMPTDGADFRVGVKVRVYNATLRNGLLAMGHPIYQSAKEIGISLDMLYQYMRFQHYPTLERAARICAYIGIPIDDVFPEHLANMKPRRVQPLELTQQEYNHMVKYAQFTNPFNGVERGLPAGSGDEIARVMAMLKPREQRVITLRFGLEDGRTLTLEAVGAELSLTPERIRQIEAKALRKLRHHTRSKRLEELLR